LEKKRGTPIAGDKPVKATAARKENSTKDEDQKGAIVLCLVWDVAISRPRKNIEGDYVNTWKKKSGGGKNGNQSVGAIHPLVRRAQDGRLMASGGSILGKRGNAVILPIVQGGRVIKMLKKGTIRTFQSPG